MVSNKIPGSNSITPDKEKSNNQKRREKNLSPGGAGGS